MSTNARRVAFTLIEVLIVVVIMAVLAATIIPQFASSSNDAKTSALKFHLHGIRQQIELYKLQHNGAVPALTAGALPGLIYTSDVNGTTTTTTVADSSHPFGPYMQGGAFPANPFDGTVTITEISTFPPTSTSGTGQGWLYEPVSGQITANTAGQLTN